MDGHIFLFPDAPFLWVSSVSGFLGTATAHGVAQGIIAEASGGTFYSGFASGLIGHASGLAIGDIGGDGGGAIISRTTVAAMFGGLAAEATGGSFEDGAFQAAMVHLFNHEVGRVAQQKGFSDGVQQYFKDQATFIKHLDDLSGANGAEAQSQAALRNEILMTGIGLLVNDAQIEYNGEIISARGLARSQIASLISSNPSYFAGRLTANIGTAGVLSFPFAKGGVTGLGAAFIFGTSLQTTATLGGGIRLIDAGITNPISVISGGFVGSQ